MNRGLDLSRGQADLHAHRSAGPRVRTGAKRSAIHVGSQGVQDAVTDDDPRWSPQDRLARSRYWRRHRTRYCHATCRSRCPKPGRRQQHQWQENRVLREYPGTASPQQQSIRAPRPLLPVPPQRGDRPRCAPGTPLADERIWTPFLDFSCNHAGLSSDPRRMSQEFQRHMEARFRLPHAPLVPRTRRAVVPSCRRAVVPLCRCAAADPARTSPALRESRSRLRDSRDRLARDHPMIRCRSH
jgi:hypothetical protein